MKIKSYLVHTDKLKNTEYLRSTYRFNIKVMGHILRKIHRSKNNIHMSNYGKEYTIIAYRGTE